MEAFVRNILTQGASIFVARFGSTHVDSAEPFVRVLEQYCPKLNNNDNENDNDTDDPSSSFLLFDACLWIDEIGTVVKPFLRAALLDNENNDNDNGNDNDNDSDNDNHVPPGLRDFFTGYGTGRKPPEYHESDKLDHQRPNLLTAPQHALIAWCIAMPLVSALQQMVFLDREERQRQHVVDGKTAIGKTRNNLKNNNEAKQHHHQQQRQPPPPVRLNPSTVNSESHNNTEATIKQNN